MSLTETYKPIQSIEVILKTNNLHYLFYRKSHQTNALLPFEASCIILLIFSLSRPSIPALLSFSSILDMSLISPALELLADVDGISICTDVFFLSVKPTYCLLQYILISVFDGCYINSIWYIYIPEYIPRIPAYIALFKFVTIVNKMWY